MPTPRTLAVLLLAGLTTPITAAQGATNNTQNRATELEIVTVLGERDRTAALPGSHQVIGGDELTEMRVMTTSEALRKAAGINVRDEEGFGLRPNIGLRGLNPTRSTKMLLLEDGLPLAYAPYGDNASYYHPPIDRFDRIEILKGAAVNQYGPQTIGGVINYITPTPPDDPAGLLRITAGNQNYRNVHGTLGGHGLQLDVVDKRGDGARNNVDSRLRDLNLKALFEPAAGHTLILRANRYEEDSDITYSGITDAEFARFGRRYNPFDNDTFETARNGFSVTHAWDLGSAATLTTHVYTSTFTRDWWRQASSTSDSQCNATRYPADGGSLTFSQARAAGLRVDADDCASRQGRLRDYDSAGIEPHIDLDHRWLGIDSTLTLGARLHTEHQARRQLNGTEPTTKRGVEVENNDRQTDARAAFVQNRMQFGRLEVAPGLRVEHIQNDRENDLSGAQGDAALTEWLPSLGLNFALTDDLTLFAGAHRGFAPPRTEDLIDNSGVVTDVAPEESLNLEFGVHARLGDGVNVDVTAFRNTFDNQIVVGSIAGGSTPLAEGETEYAGVELSVWASLEALTVAGWTPYLQLAYTWLPKADIESPFRRVDTGALIAGANAGNRLPYAPEHLLTASIGAELAAGVDVHLEYVLVDDQYADFANTEIAPANGNGQIGEISSYRIWNVSANWTLPGQPVTLFATAKNLADDSYIVDRTRGILTAPPRLVQAGVEVRF